MHFKKALSVFLAALMFFGTMSLGLTGAAAEIDYNTQYELLAEALKNEHVRELTNYKVVNKTLKNSTAGFDPVAKGFAYDHTVIAQDNQTSDILRASNRFFYIAEALMSFQYGVGCYDAGTLISYITEKLEPYFFAEDGSVMYEDFFGNRYYPTEEEIALYNDAVQKITEAGLEVDKITLPEYGLQFIEKNYWEYYNVDTVLRYFMGNSISVNAGNYYHRFSFVVETSINVYFEDCNGVYDVDTQLILRRGAYQFAYQKFYNESTSKSYYAFAEPSLRRVWNSYGNDYDFTQTPEDLSGPQGITEGGQASALLVNTTVDTTTVPFMRASYEAFMSFLRQENAQNTYIKWDEIFTVLTDNEIDNPYEVVWKLGFNPVENGGENQRIFKTRIQNVKNKGNQIFSDTYSNKALVSLFGNDLGNMITLYYLFKKTSESPTRIVRGNATYTASPEKIDKVIYSLDALVSPRDGEEGNDIKIANRVVTIVNQFLDVGELLGVQVEYKTLEELVGQVLQSLVFTDSIVNMLMELLYPMIVDLLEDNIGSISVVGGTIMSLLGTILTNNDLAIYPNSLADLLQQDYGSTYSVPAQILKNAGKDWSAVNFDAIKWGVDDAPAAQKADVFLDALCAGLCGFTRLLVTFICGDIEYDNDERSSLKNANFGRYYDLELSEGIFFVSQGLYSRVFIPLYRVLGIPTDLYLDAEDYHAAIDNDYKVCLRNAVAPLISWITQVVAKKPFQTIMALLPNLVYFLSRENNLTEQQKSDLAKYQEYWSEPDFLTAASQANAHRGYSLLQGANLNTILDNIHISLSIIGQGLDIGTLGSLLGDTLGMLSSINGLLNELIDFGYDTDQVDHANIVAYSSNDGTIVLPDSEEYGLNPGKYPNAHFVYYADVSNTKFSLTQDDEHPYKHENLTYIQKDYYIPSIPEGKLISVGPIRTDWNTITVEHPGKVFVFLLRYVLSALGYKYTINDPTLPTLIECLGIDMESELFLGLTFGDIIYNVMIHPDEALCALLELFQSGETGNFYKNDPYTYPLQPIQYHEKTLLNKTINPTMTYGSDVKYSQYWTKENADDFIANLTPLAEDILGMLGLEGFEGGLGEFLKGMINDMLFTNDLVNTVFNLIYQLLGGLNDSIGFDIEAILEAVLDVKFKPADVAASLAKMIGHETPASAKIASISSWAELFTIGYEVDPVTGKQTAIIGDVDLDWGIDTAEEHGHNRGDSFLKTLSALLAPASFLIKFLFMDQDLSILGLINLPGYAGYQYAFIGLLEALSCPNILTYKDYYEASQDPVCGDANTIYYLFTPILSLLESAYADPLNVILSLIPNLLFFISIGGFNDLVNNLVHFAYVLLDILKPILNGYDLVSGLLANLEIAGLSLNLSLPLDIDFNALVSDLLGSLLGDTLTIEGVSIKLPYIDLYTLCVGTLQRFNSKEVRTTVFLNATGGGDLLTAILRVVLEALYMEENHEALSKIIAGLAEEGRLDAYDEETLYMVLHGLIGLIEEYEVIDIILFAVYKLITVLVPIADVLAERLAANDMTITELIDSAGDQDQFVENLGKLLEDPNKVDPPGQADDGEAIFSLLDRIKMFFEKIKMFFQNLFKF